MNAICNATITELKVEKAVSALKNKKSPGCDNVFNELIKHVGPQMIKLLCILFNNCLNSGTFPDALKLSIICLLYKKKANGK